MTNVLDCCELLITGKARLRTWECWEILLPFFCQCKLILSIIYQKAKQKCPPCQNSNHGLELYRTSRKGLHCVEHCLKSLHILPDPLSFAPLTSVPVPFRFLSSLPRHKCKAPHGALALTRPYSAFIFPSLFQPETHSSLEALGLYINCPPETRTESQKDSHASFEGHSRDIPLPSPGCSPHGLRSSGALMKLFWQSSREMQMLKS